jgi:hypothetical protein
VASAEVRDLSRHGALLRVANLELAGLDPQADGAGLFAAGNLLGDGFDLDFVVGVRATARLVRISWRPGDEEYVYVGCEFEQALEATALARLGLSRRLCLPETGVGTPPAALMSYVADPERTLSLAIFDTGREAIYAGPLVGLQGSSLATHLAPADPTAVVARLSGQAHTVAIAPRGAKPWTSQAHLLAVRLLDGRTDAVEVVLTVSPPPNRSIVRRMRPRTPLAVTRNPRG